MIGTVGSPGRRKYACSECTGRSPSTVRPAATIAWPATCPPNTRWRSSLGETPRKRLTSSGSRSSSAIRSSSAVPMPGRKLTEEDARDVVQGRVDELQLLDRVVDRDPHDLTALQGHHGPERALVHGVHGRDPEAGREHAVERGGSAAPQDVAEDRDP